MDMDTISLRQKMHQKIFYTCCMLLSFSIPIYRKLLPPVILVMVLNWIIEGKYLKTFPLIFREPGRRNTALFSAIYIVYLFGMLYTSDYSFGWFDLEIKFSLLIFPLIFSTLDQNAPDRDAIRKFLMAYVAGCILGSLILIIHAGIREFGYGITDSFFYTNLSWSFHPSYFAMYLTFACAILFEYIFFSGKHVTAWKTAALLALVVFFGIMIFLLSSRGGILCLMMVTFYIVMELIFRRRKVLTGGIVLVLATLCFYLAFHIFSFALNRMKQTEPATGNSVQDGNTSQRLTVWKTSVSIIKKNFLFGVGTGDVKDELKSKYREVNLKDILIQELNAHNQYLQTFIALGIIGFLVLVLALFMPATGALRWGQILYFAFLLVFIVNNLVESMLETQAGVVFYAFMNVLLFRLFLIEKEQTA
jgi:O-antigen ligase